MTKINASRKEKAAWVLFVGIWGALVSVIMGTIACVTLVGIPVGIRQFKFIKLLFTNDDVAVTYRPDASHRLRGLYWYVFGGVVTKVVCLIFPTLLNTVGAGKSVVLRHERIAPYLSCPFDCEFLENGRYSKNCNTAYDYKLLQRRIYKSPTTAIFDEGRGKLITVRRCIKGFENEIFSIKRTTRIIFFLFLGIIVFGSASLIGGIKPAIEAGFGDIGAWWGIFVGILLFSIGFIGCIVTNIIQTSQFLRIHDEKMSRFFELFEDTDPYDQDPPKISFDYVFDALYKDREAKRLAQNTKRN